MKSIFICLLFIVSMISAQALELSNPCVDEITTSAHDDKDFENKHCHDTCSQCHTVLITSPDVMFFSAPEVLPSQIPFMAYELLLKDYQLSVDRPPIFFA